MMRATLRRARRERRCTGLSSAECLHVIRVGDLYGHAVASPHHDDYGNERWWTSRVCLPCARHYSATWPPSLFASDSHASVSPEQTPTAAADSAHRGDQCTDGGTS